jgi:nitroreductase
VEFSDVIKRRESVRSYDPARPVPKEVLERILEAGRIAPSAANRQPLRFLLVSSPKMLAEVRRCYDKPWFRDAPHVLIVVGKASQAWTREKDGYNSLETDIAIAMDHMILAAENEGVGTCWIAAYDPAALRKALDLSSHEDVFAITPLGYPRAGYVRKTEKPRKSLGDISEFV